VPDSRRQFDAETPKLIPIQLGERFNGKTTRLAISLYVKVNPPLHEIQQISIYNHPGADRE
jgi:hypothetical protein